MPSTHNLIRRWAAAGAAALLTTTALIPAATAQDERRGSPTMLVLDSSGSMTADDAGGQTRIDAAREAAHTFIDEVDGTLDLGLVTYGGNTGDSPEEHDAGCRDITMVTAPGNDTAGQIKDHIDHLDARGYTPIGESLRTAADELPDSGGTIVLVSDGIATCTPPPVCEVAKELADQGVDIIINTVGFNVDDAAREELECIAEAAGGTYADASDADTLADELKRAATRGYRAYQSDAERIPATDDDLKAETVPLDTTTFLTGLTPFDKKPPTSGERTSSYFYLPVRPGERVVVSAQSVQAPTVNQKDRLALLLDMTNPEDRKSCRMGFESELDLDTNQVVTGTAYSDEVGEDCDTDGILLNIERSGNQRWNEEVDVEVTITRIPPFTLADGRDAPNTDNSTSASATTSEEDASIPRLTSDEPEPITPGIWFTDAAELTPGEMITADIVPGETQFFKIPAEYGQKVNGRIRLVEEANGFDRGGSYSRTINLNAYNEARAGIDLSDSYVNVMENKEIPFEYNHRILFDHRFGSGEIYRTGHYWQDGDQYLTVRYEDPEQGDIDGSSQLPPLTYIMTVNTTGQVVPGPEFASFPGEESTSATSAPAEDTESPEDTDARAVADNEDSGTSPVVWIIVGLVVLAALGAVGYVLTRARRN